MSWIKMAYKFTSVSLSAFLMCWAMNSTPFNALDTLTFEEPPGAMSGWSNDSFFVAFLSNSKEFSVVAEKRSKQLDTFKFSIWILEK